MTWGELHQLASDHGWNVAGHHRVKETGAMTFYVKRVDPEGGSSLMTFANAVHRNWPAGMGVSIEEIA